ncbi:MAG TPA: DUF3108 domain-containing protein [Pyrinomonadaceae bacterium]|jgi:hypothetical protein
MQREKNQISSLIKNTQSKRFFTIFVLAAAFVALFVFSSSSAQNVTVVTAPASIFRVGERLTYNISFEKFNNAGYAELYVVSRGKLAERDAIELRSKIKTNDIVSAAFYLLDETRTTYASPEKGLPLYTRKTENVSIVPRENISNFLGVPTVNHDLLTLIYQARSAGGIGNFSLQENEKIYNVSLIPAGGERIRTDAGEYDTVFSNVQSEFLTERGLMDLKVNFSNDERKIPVAFRFKTVKGEFRVMLAGVQVLEADVTEPTPTPIPFQTPRPVTTPTPIPTPAAYAENQPLIKELPFQLGETLNYQISNAGIPVGNIRFEVKERKLFAGQDSLLLNATITSSSPGNPAFISGDGIKAHVNPDSIAPQQIELKFTGNLSAYNQTTVFNQKTGSAMLGGIQRIEIPVGTHSLLSLIYAIRSFNLKPSKDPKNPVNDTRVAVFWDKQPYVFTLRPSTADLINLRGEKVSAQQISINTGDSKLDMLSLRLWLSNDEKRVPLRFSVGNYQADLITDIPQLRP